VEYWLAWLCFAIGEPNDYVAGRSKMQGSLFPENEVEGRENQISS
jgi:hypothetical protein